MRNTTGRKVGLLVGAIILILAQWLSGETRATEFQTPWREVREGVWLRTMQSVRGPVFLTYTRDDGDEWFAITLPCGNTPRMYTVAWARGDETGIVHVTCDGREYGEYDVRRLEGLFTDLPDGAPPSKPAEVFMEDNKHYA
jgi:hypothetical protein